MAPERQPDIRLTGIHIDLVDRVVTLDAEDGRKARVSFGQQRTSPVDTSEHLTIAPESDTPDELTAEDDHSWEELMPPASLKSPPPLAAEPSAETRERHQTTVLSGSLRTQPKAGPPDRQGNPTAWARLAVHEEDSEQERVFSATFHRDSTAAALALTKGAQITVEGYPHLGDPSRKRPTDSQSSPCTIIRAPSHAAREGR